MLRQRSTDQGPLQLAYGLGQLLNVALQAHRCWSDTKRTSCSTCSLSASTFALST
jgi:hypothetical protein